jgi:GTPase Era involved in 16S rRNA processing
MIIYFLEVYKWRKEMEKGEKKSLDIKEIMELSSLTSKGIALLLDTLKAKLPLSPFFNRSSATTACAI